MIKRRSTGIRRNDSGVSEVIGFLLMFVISSFLLVIAMSTFNNSQDTSEGVVTAVEMKSVAARVASRVLEASIVAQDFPNATYEIQVDLPTPPNDRDYRVTLTASSVDVDTTKGSATATTTTYKLDAINDLVLSGEVYSYHKTAVIRYAPVISGSTLTKTITLLPLQD